MTTVFNLTKREQIIIISAFITVAACIGFILLGADNQEPIQIDAGNAQSSPALQTVPTDNPEQQEQFKKIIIDVKGKVRNPGIVMLEEGKRIYDAIESAGGAQDTANLDAINLAAYLKDGQCIYVPEKGEEINNAEIIGSQQLSEEDKSIKININTANEEELMKLPGVGPATAKKIIDFRNQQNSFTYIEDILNVSGIGEKKFEQIKDLIDIR